MFVILQENDQRHQVYSRDIHIRRACGHVDVGTCPHQVLAATLTLYQPEGADYAHPVLVSTPSFENHRRACSKYIINMINDTE